jgi:hypothetical protein
LAILGLVTRKAILVKVPDAEDRLFRRAAKRQGSTLSGWVRGVARRAANDASTLSGYTDEGASERASFTVGLRADKPRPKSITQKKGTVIKTEVAQNEFARLRIAQVGPKGASATITRCEGRWADSPAEPTMVCEVEHIPSPKEARTRQFKKNMIALAEQLAERLGQHEVWLRLGGRLIRANAPGERGPKPLRRRGRVRR